MQAITNRAADLLPVKPAMIRSCLAGSLRRWRFFLLSLIALPAIADAQTIDLENSRSGLFAGRDVSYEVVLSGKPNEQLALKWKLTAKARILSKGQKKIELDGSGRAMTRLEITSPTLKPSVVMAVNLSISAFNVERSEQVGAASKILRLYGDDALWAQRNKLEALKIQLFDPEGTTSNGLKALSIPYNRVSRSELLNAPAPGLLLVGENLVLDDHRGLSSVLQVLASEGRRILILRPFTGVLPLSDSFGLSDGPSALSFTDAASLSLLDDLTSSMPSMEANRQLKLASSRHGVVVRIESDPEDNGWCWLKLDFSGSGGQLIVFTLPLIEHLDESPQPQIVLARLLIRAGSKSF